ncbi:MAG: hypothetical protein WDW38_001840 [Sanguina aurantia]
MVTSPVGLVARDTPTGVYLQHPGQVRAQTSSPQQPPHPFQSHACYSETYPLRPTSPAGGSSGSRSSSRASASGPSPPSTKPPLSSSTGQPLPAPRQVQLQGQPDWPLCQELASRLVSATATAAPKMKYVALNGFYVVWSFLGVPPSAPPEALRRATVGHCATAWAPLSALHPGQANVHCYCLWGAYVAALVQQGLKLQAQEVAIGGCDWEWLRSRATQLVRLGVSAWGFGSHQGVRPQGQDAAVAG